MTTNSKPVLRNHVLMSTRPDAQSFITERLQTRAVTAGETLFDHGDPIHHAIFPQSGVISMLSQSEGGKSVEQASIGNEGFLGFTYLMGGGSVPARAMVQISGEASWLTIADLEEAMTRFVCVRAALLRYSQALIIQLMETIACNGLHSAEQRIASWLLLADRRMQGRTFALTQDGLGRALGLRRATVSNICSDLQRAGAITYSRGHLAVVDRAGLRNHACSCHDRIEAGMIVPGVRDTLPK